MATPLSDEIRALITYANETTEAGDAKLGDCVKTLVEGYNGGKNIPSSPMVVPSGALSSRLAALLAYANETTGAGDTTMGDAIRTLCEGYGGGEVVFYEKLVTDGVACVMTDYRPSNLTTQSIYFKGEMPEYKAGAIWWGCTNSSASSGAWWRMYQSSSTDTGYRRYNYVAFGSTTRSYNTFASGTVILDIETKATKLSETSFSLESKTGSQTVTGEKTIAEQATGQMPALTVLGNTSSTGAVACNLPSGSFVRKFEIEDAELGTLTYVPCTYNGEAGLWCLQTQTFFGNAASSGQFTVEGEIVMYDRLIGDGTAYIDTGILAKTNQVLTYDFINHARKTWNTIIGASDVWRYRIYATLSIENEKKVRVLINSHGDTGLTYIAAKTYTAKHRLVIDIPNSSAKYDDGDWTVCPGSNEPPSVTTWRIFGGGGYGANVVEMTVCGLLIEEEGKAVMDLKPCTYNGEAGMWDMVGWKFYGNSNTSGAFTAENES